MIISLLACGKFSCMHTRLRWGFDSISFELEFAEITVIPCHPTVPYGSVCERAGTASWHTKHRAHRRAKPDNDHNDNDDDDNNYGPHRRVPNRECDWARRRGCSWARPQQQQQQRGKHGLENWCSRVDRRRRRRIQSTNSRSHWTRSLMLSSKPSCCVCVNCWTIYRRHNSVRACKQYRIKRRQCVALHYSLAVGYVIALESHRKVPSSYDDDMYCIIVWVVWVYYMALETLEMVNVTDKKNGNHQQVLNLFAIEKLFDCSMKSNSKPYSI